jgi:hypothetical protein
MNDITILDIDRGYIMLSTPFWGEVAGVDLLLIRHPDTQQGRFELFNSDNRETIRARAVKRWWRFEK